jgi:PAS domain-containing protein
MLELDLSDLPSALDQVVLAEDPSGRWQLAARAPAWFGEIRPAVDPSSGFSVEEWSPFLETFLLNARDFLARNPAGRLRSGPWTEVSAGGADVALEATALFHRGRMLLVVRRLGEEYVEKQEILQKAREGSLEYQVLEAARDALVLILNQLELGALSTDASGRVTFISEPARRLFDLDEKAVLGCRWQDLEILDAPGRRRLGEMAALPPSARRRVPSHWERPDGRAFWVEVDLRDDPTDARRKILFLYDASEVHDLRRLLDSQGRSEDMVGKSPGMRRVYELVDNLAGVDSTVLVEGVTRPQQYPTKPPLRRGLGVRCLRRQPGKSVGQPPPSGASPPTPPTAGTLLSFALAAA